MAINALHLGRLGRAISATGRWSRAAFASWAQGPSSSLRRKAASVGGLFYCLSPVDNGIPPAHRMPFAFSSSACIQTTTCRSSARARSQREAANALGGMLQQIERGAFDCLVIRMAARFCEIAD